jgi:hypothetical protein
VLFGGIQSLYGREEHEMTLDTFRMLIALAVLALFVGIYVYLIFVSWRSATLSPFSPQFVFVANALAATIGTIVATTFGQELPPGPTTTSTTVASSEPTPPAAPAVNPNLPAKALVQAATVETGQTWRENVSASYTIAYFVLGIAAIVTWLFKKKPPEMVTTLAYITFGLMLNIARSGF